MSLLENEPIFHIFAWTRLRVKSTPDENRREIDASLFVIENSIF